LGPFPDRPLGSWGLPQGRSFRKEGMKKNFIAILILLMLPDFLFAVRETDWIHKHPANWAEEVVGKFIHSNSMEERKKFVRQPELLDPDVDYSETDYWGYSTTFLTTWSRPEGCDIAFVYVVTALNGGKDDEYFPNGDTYYVVRMNGQAKIDLALGAAETNPYMNKWLRDHLNTTSNLGLAFDSVPGKEPPDHPFSSSVFPESQFEEIHNRQIDKDSWVHFYVNKNGPGYRELKNYIEAHRQSDDFSNSILVEVGPVHQEDGQYSAEITKKVQTGWFTN
jgi:hypothetical protein